MVPRPTIAAPQPSCCQQPLGAASAEGLKSTEPPATALEPPPRPGMLLRRLPAHTSTVPCSRGFPAGANTHRDRGLVPARWIHPMAPAASAPRHHPPSLPCARGRAGSPRTPTTRWCLQTRWDLLLFYLFIFFKRQNRGKPTKLGLPLASPPSSSRRNQAVFILQQTGGESQEIRSDSSLSSRRALVFDMSVSKCELQLQISCLLLARGMI